MTMEADEAYPNGTRVEKTASVGGFDTHSDGALGRTVSCVGFAHGEYCYYVRWDDAPGSAVFIAGHRLKRVDA